MHTSLPRRLAVLVAVAALAVAFAACSSSGSKGAAKSNAPAAITIHNFSFTTSPVASGSTVTVQNKDNTDHTVTSDDGTSFNMKVPAGTSVTFTAPSKAGTFKFHCNIHASMHGALTVT